jgi:hypothetical protein
MTGNKIKANLQSMPNIYNDKKPPRMQIYQDHPSLGDLFTCFIHRKLNVGGNKSTLY